MSSFFTKWYALILSNRLVKLMGYLFVVKMLYESLSTIYKLAVLQVLDTHIFHSFLRDRLSKKMDIFARMELSTRSEMQKYVTLSIEYSKRSLSN